MTWPLDDWQFWVVSFAALWGVVVLVRQLLPSAEAPPCGGCASGAAACSKPTPTASGVRASHPDDDGLVTIGSGRPRGLPPRGR